MVELLRRLVQPLVAGTILVFAPIAGANTIKLVSTGATGTGPYNYTFQVTLDASGELVSGPNVQSGHAFGSSFVTLYDVPGITGASFAPDVVAAAFSAPTLQALGRTPDSPTDPGFGPIGGVTDGAGNNVTLAYNGGSPLHISSLPSFALNGDHLLGTLSVTTTSFIASGTFLQFAMQDNANPGGNDEALLSNVPVVVPTPASAGMGLALLGGIGGLNTLRLVRRRQQQAL